MSKVTALGRTAFILVLLTLLTGCPEILGGRGGVGSYFSSDKAQKKNVDQTSSQQSEVQDTVIMASVKAAMKRDQALSPYYLYADSVQGEVLLYGSVPNVGLSNRAIGIAKKISGVQSVISKIQVQQ